MTEHVYCQQTNCDLLDLGTIDQFYRRNSVPWLPPLESVRSAVEKIVVEQSSEECRYFIVEACATCHARPGLPRTDNDLFSGYHCDDCWRNMVNLCRRRSW